MGTTVCDAVQEAEPVFNVTFAGQAATGDSVSIPMVVAEQVVETFPDASVATMSTSALSANGMNEPATGVCVMVITVEQLSVAVYMPKNDGTSMVQVPVAKELDTGATAGQIRTGAITSCGVRVTVGLKPFPHPT